MMMNSKGVMIISMNRMYIMIARKTKLNNNVLVVGESESGKLVV